MVVTIFVKFSFIVTNVNKDAIEAFVALLDDANVEKLLENDLEDDVWITDVICELWGDVVEVGLTGSEVNFCFSDELKY